MRDAEEKIGEPDHYGSFHRVIEPNGSMTGRILVGTDCAGEQISDRLLFP